MKDKKFASFLAAAAALVLLAMPAFAADEQTELPAAEAADCSRTLRATLPNATPPLWARALGWTASTRSIWACPA